MLFLGVWAIISWFLLFSPIQFQRRLGNGLHLPMVLIGCWWFFRVCQRWQGTWAERWWKNFKLNYLLAGLVIFLLVSSNLLLIGAEYFASRYLKIFYLSVPEKQAMLWLKDNLRPGELILSSAKKGNLIPALSGRLVYLGHGHQTNNWPEKKAKVEEWFFKSNGSDEQKARWLKAAGIDWLFFGPSENALGDFNPQAKDYLQPVFKQGKITVFKVVN